jgi:hypothetical protein
VGRNTRPKHARSHGERRTIRHKRAESGECHCCASGALFFDPVPGEDLSATAVPGYCRNCDHSPLEHGL